MELGRQKDSMLQNFMNFSSKFIEIAGLKEHAYNRAYNRCTAQLLWYMWRDSFTESKFLKMKAIEDERLEVEAKIAELKTTLKDRQERHIDFLYQKNRVHDMESQ